MSASDPENTSSKAPVIVLVGFIVIGTVAWGVWTLRMGGGIDPEVKKKMADEANRECILAGIDPEDCKKIVGKHHRACLEQARGRSTEDARLKLHRDDYIACMSEHFETSDQSGSTDTPDTESPSTPDTSGSGGPDTSPPNDPKREDAGGD